MSLITAMSSVLGDAASFRLMGEDLALLTGAQLRDALADYEATLERTVPAPLRSRFEKEQTALVTEAHQWLHKYNRSVHARIRGYLALGREAGFEYPWPVIAILGICQVLSGQTQARLYGLLGLAASRIGFRTLEYVTDGADDILRRTNRGIFADSVPTVLWALRAHALRRAGEQPIAEALLGGPPPLVLDAQSQSLAQSLYRALAIPDGHERFHTLAKLTLRHFDREQAIFSYHIGTTDIARSTLRRRMAQLRSVPAPVIERTRHGRRVVFKPFALPNGFDMRDHEARVAAFGRAFVTSVSGDIDDYRAAVNYVVHRFGRAGERAVVAFH